MHAPEWSFAASSACSQGSRCRPCAPEAKEIKVSDRTAVQHRKFQAQKTSILAWLKHASKNICIAVE